MSNSESIVGRRFNLSGFTLPEVMAVVAVIALLLAILMPALSGVMRTGQMTASQNNMKQISLWMTNYSSENRDFVVPSQFNYTDPASPTAPAAGYPIKVRSSPSLPVGLRYKGTWCDILWAYNSLGSKQTLGTAAPPAESEYLYDSPDKAVYQSIPNYDLNPFRSAASNTRSLPNADGTPKPFGNGALEESIPGFFAANNFFNADRDAPDINGVAPPQIGRWYVTGQIKDPQQSMYLVDSFAGETIEPKDDPGGPYDNYTDADADGRPDFIEVDFRYNGACLMMFLDGHSAPQGPWKDLTELQKDRRIRIQRLDKR